MEPIPPLVSCTFADPSDGLQAQVHVVVLCQLVSQMSAQEDSSGVTRAGVSSRL
jgi:hypothetical protein